jgi:hypothetical protein
MRPEVFASVIARVVVLAAIVAVAAIFGSATGSEVYPWKGTTLFSLAVVLEVAVLLRILRPTAASSLGIRALVAALLALIALWFSAQDTLGAPEYVFMHQRWLAWVALACCAIAASRGVARIRHRNARRR